MVLWSVLLSCSCSVKGLTRCKRKGQIKSPQYTSAKQPFPSVAQKREPIQMRFKKKGKTSVLWKGTATRGAAWSRLFFITTLSTCTVKTCHVISPSLD